MIYLTDDGTMDTVLKCSDCGGEMRYSYDGVEFSLRQDEDGYWIAHHDGDAYDAFVDWAIEDATAGHECGVSE